MERDTPDENAPEGIWQAIKTYHAGMLAVAKGRAMSQHGIDCQKVEHLAAYGHLHSATDDRPYDVDGIAYCGRCHGWLGAAPPSPATGAEREAAAPAPSKPTDEMIVKYLDPWLAVPRDPQDVADIVAAVRALFALASPHPTAPLSEPEGWKLVPIEPTAGQVAAMKLAWWTGKSAHVMKTTDAYRVHAAMLGGAPDAPLEQPK